MSNKSKLIELVNSFGENCELFKIESKMVSKKSNSFSYNTETEEFTTAVIKFRK